MVEWNTTCRHNLGRWTLEAMCQVEVRVRHVSTASKISYHPSVCAVVPLGLPSVVEIVVLTHAVSNKSKTSKNLHYCRFPLHPSLSSLFSADVHEKSWLRYLNWSTKHPPSGYNFTYINDFYNLRKLYSMSNIYNMKRIAYLTCQKSSLIYWTHYSHEYRKRVLFGLDIVSTWGIAKKI